MKEYIWRSCEFDADANKVGRELRSINEKFETEVSNFDVVEYAQMHKDSELHKCFEWDNSVAGQKYRLMQANKILFSIAVVVKEQPKMESATQTKVTITEKKDKTKRIIVEPKQNDRDEKIESFKNGLRRTIVSWKKVNGFSNAEIKTILFDLYREF